MINEILCSNNFLDRAAERNRGVRGKRFFGQGKISLGTYDVMFFSKQKKTTKGDNQS